MKKKIIAMLLAILTVIGISVPVTFADTEEAKLYDTFAANKLGESQNFTDETTGLTAKLTTYADDKSENNGAVILYVINHDGEYPGTEDDDSIISDFLKEGYTVVVADYIGNNGLAKSPAIEESLFVIRKDILIGSKYLNGRQIDTTKTYVVPAGYRIMRNVEYFNMYTQGSDCALQHILDVWNGNLERTDGKEFFIKDMVEYNGDVWAEAETVFDIIMREKVDDGSGNLVNRKMTEDDMKYRLDIIYPSEPVKETPVAMLAADATPRNRSVFITSSSRVHNMGFLFRGYTFVCYDHEYYPYLSKDNGGWGHTEPLYTHQMYDGNKMHTAAVRCVKYYSDILGYSKEKIGVYGHSKSSWASVLSTPTPDLVPESSSVYAPSRGELPYLKDINGNELDASVSCVYYSMGNGASMYERLLTNQNVPTVICCGQEDKAASKYWEKEKTAYKKNGTEFLAIDMEDEGHTFPCGEDTVYDYNRYVAFCKFFDYYLKDTAPEILYTSLVDGKVKTLNTPADSTWTVSDGGELFVQFTAPVTEWSFLEAVTLKDSQGNKVVGSWYAQGNGNRWIFAGELSESETYTLTISDNAVKDKYGRVVEKGN